MIPVLEQFVEIFRWLIRSSFQATILLAIILLIRMLIGRKFHFRMVYWLWILLLLRLIWPLNLQTTFSVFNLIPHRIGPNHYLSPQTAEEEQSDESAAGLHLSEPVISEPDASSDMMTVTMSSPVDSGPGKSVTASGDSMNFLCMIWLFGAWIMAVWVLFNNFRLWRIIKRGTVDYPTEDS